MAITFRANKGQALSYGEMDTNLGSYFYSSSINHGGRSLVLHYTSSQAVPISKASHEVPLVKGIQPGSDKRVAFYSGSATLTTTSGFIVSGSSVGINVNEFNDLPLTYTLEVSGSIRTSAALYQSSDERLKHNIETVDNALSKITSSRGVFFDRNNNIREAGVVAQEIEKTIPEVVSKDSKDYLSVNYNGIVGVLIEAIKEQNKRIDELEEKLSKIQTS